MLTRIRLVVGVIALGAFFTFAGCGGGGGDRGDQSEVVPSSTPAATASPSPTATPMVGPFAWAVDQRHVLRSTDGGLTWTVAMTASETVALQSIAFVDREHGWVVGGSDPGFGTALFHTDDGGRTWTDQLPNITGLAEVPPDIYSFGFLDVAFTDASHGVAVGAERQHVGIFAPPALVIVTDDGGASWRTADILEPDRRGPLRSVCLNPNGTGIAVGNGFLGGGLVITTADGGFTWHDIGRQIDLNPGDEFTTITSAACAAPSSFWISGTNIGVVGHRPTLLYSPSAGVAWFDRTPSASSAFRVFPLSFVDGSFGWTIPGPMPGGTTLFIEKTTNAGETWHQVELPAGSDHVYRALAFLDRDHGIAVGDGRDSTSLASSTATADGGVTWGAGEFPPGLGGLVAVTIVP